MEKDPVEVSYELVDSKLDELEEIVLGMPIQKCHKQTIVNKLYEIMVELELGLINEEAA